METQNAVAEIGEGGSVTVHSSTQTLDGVQSAVARALGIQAHAVTVGELLCFSASHVCEKTNTSISPEDARDSMLAVM